MPPDLWARLPAELRLQIYELLFDFDGSYVRLACSVPVQCVYEAAIRRTAILRVNRQTYREALPEFYRLNTIVVFRSDLCEKRAEKSPLTFSPRYARQIVLLDQRKSCWCTKHSCRWCQMPILDLAEDLLSQPSMRSVRMSYSGHVQELRAIREQGVDPGSPLQVECTNFFTYLLSGPWPANKELHLIDYHVGSAWLAVFGPDGVYPKSNLAVWDEWLGLPRKQGQCELFDTLKNVHKMHEVRKIPLSFMAIWPKDLPLDLFAVKDLVGRPAFLQALGDVVRNEKGLERHWSDSRRF